MNEEAPEGALADRRVHPATVPLRFLKEAPSTLLGLPAIFAFTSQFGLREILAFAGLMAAAGIGYQWLAWRRFRYGFGARELVIESGILSRTRRSIPFERMQDVDIEQGPLARLFGLAKLRIETGGSAGEEGVLDSVRMEEAERIRGALRAARGVVGAPDVKPEPDLLFAMSMPRVIAAGLFNFSMIYLASLFALLQAFDDWLPFDIYDPARWIGLVEGRLGGKWSFGAVAAVGLFALLLGVLTGVVRTLARDHGFRLTREGDGLRRVRGLFTRSEVLIPRRRVQLAVVESGPFRRLFGWSGLGLQTLGAATGGGESGRQTAVPLGTREEIAAVLAVQQGYRIAASAELSMVSGSYVVRRLIILAVPLLMLLAGSVFEPAALLALPLFGLAALLSSFQRRRHRYGISEGFLLVQRGLWRERQWIVPVGNIQSLRLSRSWLQRKLGLATLGVDTAGAPAFDALRIFDLDKDRAEELADALR